MTDVGVEMARRGHRVLVYTSARGYENPAIRYPKRQQLQGLEIRRLGLASFGKGSIFTRILGTASFMLQCIFLTLTARKLGGILFSTSPPLLGLAPCLARFVRRVPVAYWVMDLNPDQLIGLGKLTASSPAARALEAVHRLILRDSDLIVALDRFMAERINRRGDYAAKMLVMPLWPHETHLEDVPREENPFRARHGLGDKFVVMYSGNHSPANPLDTLLRAVVALKDDDRFRFLFVGGGLGKKGVEAAIREHGLTNVLSLPYQSLDQIKYSLSAADLHVVSLGNEMVGVVHPCKIYGAMAVGRPVLFLGPHPSHIADLLDIHDIGLTVAHGDVEACVAALHSFVAMPPAELAARGHRARQALEVSLSQSQLRARFCDALEQALRLPRTPRNMALVMPTGAVAGRGKVLGR
ncbi:MAG: glycosyltransferase family 4 protein [Planctomycetota bacterium]|nr:glycosyltransferase family 4 protein [Planctomycetota bacterium]